MNIEEFKIPSFRSLNISEEQRYKLQKEAFVTGFNGSSMIDVFKVTIVFPLSSFMQQLVL